MSYPALRNRRPTELVVGGLSRIMAGVFGTGAPDSNSSSPREVQGDTAREGGFYHMHEGDVFMPGTGNWVLDPSHESALQTVWGHAFLRTPNTFNPHQQPQVYSNPTVTTQGIGGLIAGQMIMQPLMEPAPEQGG